ncbi:hypothetical protein halTADL_0204 [Halohasta litchfieldiae]|nr:hypothetical protein halTADL_0204 [Halohasta litchfieldiae]
MVNGNSVGVTLTRSMEETHGMTKTDNGLYENSTIGVQTGDESHIISF